MKEQCLVKNVSRINSPRCPQLELINKYVFVAQLMSFCRLFLQDISGRDTQFLFRRFSSFRHRRFKFQSVSPPLSHIILALARESAKLLRERNPRGKRSRIFAHPYVGTCRRDSWALQTRAIRAKGRKRQIRIKHAATNS